VHDENATKAMANPRTKGKIPHGEWPRILAKYAGGETIAQIGRDYGCTAPAIRYIIRRSASFTDGGGDKGPSSGRKVLQARPSRPPTSPSGGAARRSLPHRASADGCGARESLLGTQLVTRVTGDVVSFLAALDHAVLEGSLESLAVLQDAIDALMRSAARTRIELGRILNRDEAASLRHGGAAQQHENTRLSE
jgi:hypothetical protein